MGKNLYYELRNKDAQIIDSQNNKSKLQFNVHLHKDIEIVAMFEGKTDAMCDSAKCSIESGDIFVLFPNQVHAYRSYTDENFVGFLADLDYIPELKDNFFVDVPEHPIIKNILNEDETIRNLFLGLRTCYGCDDKPYNKEIVRGYIIAILGYLLRYYGTRGLVSNKKNEVMKEIITYCNNNYMKSINLDTMEDSLHLSKYYISHIFAQKFGVSFIDYINSLRIATACRYLTYTDKRITEVWESIGFSTQRTFNRAFIKIMGVTPTKYRMIHKNN